MPSGAPTHRPPIAVTSRRSATAFVDPFAAYLALRSAFGERAVALLESLAGPDEDRRSAVITLTPLAEITVARGVVDVAGPEHFAAAVIDAGAAAGLLTDDGRLRRAENLWPLLRRIEGLFAVTAPADAAVSFGFLAFFGYDAVHYVERLPRTIAAGDDVPDVTLVLPQAYLLFNLQDERLEIVVNDVAGWPALDEARITGALAAVPAQDLTALPPAPAPLTVTDSTDATRFTADVEKCLGHIAVGDIYQVQIGHEIAVRSPIDELSVYRRLRSRNPSPYMCLLPLAGRTVIGASPELFVRITGDEVVMRPIAGTRPRTGDPARDAERIADLVADEKEIAEHVMLVDLCRNDLGRFAEPDTVAVGEMLAVQDFSHVFHLVSTVSARREAGVDAYDVVAATFPVGTMTGAPKIRAMEIIEDTENSRRGLYAGAFGLIDFGGHVNLGLCIRSLVRSGDTYRTRASAGVVADSKPENEWVETLAKMNAGFWAVTGQELV